jgi:hypothetical protein
VTYLIAIDPGKTTGIALFRDNVLINAFAGPSSEILKSPPPNAYELPIRSTAVIENPRWTPMRGVDPNDLLDLSRLVGRFEDYYTRAGHAVVLVTPMQWKGSVKKSIHNRRVLELLTAHETMLLPKRPRANDFDNNMVDAIGLGLWKLGRLRR